MATTTARLSALKVASIDRPGYFADGGNLYFRVAHGGSRGWIFRYTIGGRARDMGLGAYPQISLAAARRHAVKCRELLNKGSDPIEQRRIVRAEQRVAAARSRTFDDCARDYIADHDAGWRNAKHRAQWASTLKTYVSPIFGRLPVSTIDETLVLRALKAIWYSKPETAARLRGRIESVLDWARVNGYRTGENPARWKGHLQHSLPPRAKVQRVTHHPALPYGDVGTFITDLRQRTDAAAAPLQFVILTAVRSGEALRATWNEFDFQAKAWTVPGERMKAGVAHRVPLSRPALAILESLHDGRINDFVFPGSQPGRSLSDMAMLMLLRRMGRDDLTVHGFRSTFRDWASENTGYPNHVVEMALAHAIKDKAEAAYRRGDLFAKRRQLMDAWAEYCGRTEGGLVVPMRRA
jgi:integrase